MAHLQTPADQLIHLSCMLQHLICMLTPYLHAESCKVHIETGLMNTYACHCACREFSGRGMCQWARGGLRQRLKDMHRPQGSLTLQVETLSGLVIALDTVSCL